MSTDEQGHLIDALDAIWATCDGLYDLCSELADGKDFRSEQAREGIMKAWIAINALKKAHE